MIKKTLYSTILFILTTFFACEKEIEWELETDNINRLVVDCILTNENIQQCVKLSVTNQELNMNLQPVSGATVIVSDGEESVEFIESPEEHGSYYSSPFQAVIDKHYQLFIEYNDLVSEATAEGVSVTPLEDFQIAENDEDGLFRYIYQESGSSSMLDLNYNWEIVPEYCASYGSCYAMETFYTLGNIDVNKIYAPEKQIIWFPAATTIIRKKYSLTEDHQRFLRSLLMETEWRGGLFDVEHGNIPTNLSNGALGYFAVCMVVSDTILVN